MLCRIRNVTQVGTVYDLVVTVSKKAKITQLKRIIYRKLDIRTSQQKLYYGGKELIEGHTISDYKINNNDVIQLAVKENESVRVTNKNDDSGNIQLIETTSDYYEIGDAVDVLYDELNAWFEAKIVNIFTNGGTDEGDKIFQVVMDRGEQTAPINVKNHEIRPRARYVYKLSELTPGMVVFVNYNIQKPGDRGFWYDFKITSVSDREILGDLILNGTQNCVIKFQDEIMKIEAPVPLSNRLTRTNETIPLRKLPLYCKKCKDVSHRNCKECSCNICGKKNFTDKLIICDECECTYHLFCLVPPLPDIPEDPQWYCPDCKVDTNEIVKPGEKLKKTSRNRFKMDSYFGPVIGIDVGYSWDSFSQFLESGVHSTSASIDGDAHTGVYSILLNREEEVTQDVGDEFYYNISLGIKIPMKKSIDVEVSKKLPNKLTKMLALNCYTKQSSGFAKSNHWKKGKPIRVSRSSRIGNTSKYAPSQGYRYDGIYKVVEYFPVISGERYLVWRFLLRRDHPQPSPWDGVYTDLYQPNKKIKTEDDDTHEHLLELIDGDRANEQAWLECKKCLKSGRQEFLAKVKDYFTCVCCQEILHKPVTLRCGHNICQKCLDRCFEVEIYYCVYCRSDLGRKDKANVNWYLVAALEGIFPGYGLNR